MKKNTLYTFFASLVLISMLLTACGGKTTVVPATPAATDAAQPAATAVQAEAEPTAEAPVAAETAAPAEAGACPVATVADTKGLTSAFPQQFELDEFQKAANCDLAFSDNPLFAEA